MLVTRRRLIHALVTSLCLLYLLTCVTLSMREMFVIQGHDFEHFSALRVEKDSTLLLGTNESVQLQNNMKRHKELFLEDTSTLTFPLLGDVPSYANTAKFNWPHICSVSEDTPDGTYLVILVHSHVLNSARRDAIRDTWGRINRNYDDARHVDIIFLMGLPEDPQDVDGIEKEAKLYRDIIQWRFTDSYKNLSLKSLLGIQWVLKHCRQAKYVIKADDDVYLDVPRILNFVTNQTNQNNFVDSNFLYGHINKKSPVLRIGQWGVSMDTYPLKTYPPYCSGAAYVLAMPTAKRLCDLIDSYSHLTILPVEDVFITGILASMAGLFCHHDNRFPGWMTLITIEGVQEILRGDLFGLHGVSDKKMRMLWKMATSCQSCVNNVEEIETILSEDTDYLMYYDNMDDGITDL